MEDSNNGGPGWGGFALRMAVALAWILAGAAAGGLLSVERAPGEHIAAAVFLIAAPTVWWVVKANQMKRMDELERKVTDRGLMQGLIAANIWAGIWVGVQALIGPVFSAGGVAEPDRLMRLAIIFVGMQPAVAFLMSEAMAFALLRNYARQSGN